MSLATPRPPRAPHLELQGEEKRREGGKNTVTSTGKDELTKKDESGREVRDMRSYLNQLNIQIQLNVF